MNIIYLANSIIPSKTANSVHVMKMCSAFSSNDKVKSVNLVVPSVDSQINEFDYYGVKSKFQISRIKKTNFRFSWYIFSIFQVLHVLMKREKDSSLIYGRNILPCLILALFKYRVIYEAHSPIKRYNFIVNFIFKHIGNKLLNVVVISDSLRKIISNEYPRIENKLLVLHDAADIPLNNYIKSEVINEDVINVGYIGHLYEGRGCEIIIEVAKRFPEITFHFIGGVESDIERVKLCSTTSNIVFHGFVEPSEVECYRNSMDILVAPYQKNTSIEGKVNTSEYMSPLKIFEYMSSGKALICSDLPVLREVLIDGHNALMVVPDDIDAWENALKILKNEKVRESIGINAYDDFIKNYTWDERVNRVLDEV
ncbi:glycosyltransferase family 4 protein [Photobacterium leiognathi]|uniref:glycosyltransferase family 4 protein n=1 Tax=Photobacterium leiognathi TaxID=553611 RepID=UPI000D1746A0|nr:glycosyltransferase family 4 protein [Photobacterium leiognathi]PSW57453.1 hypothetical protein C0W50_07690 [Photobacterium leiognathi subsp. mandapamensis]